MSSPPNTPTPAAPDPPDGFQKFIRRALQVLGTGLICYTAVTSQDLQSYCVGGAMILGPESVERYLRSKL